VTRGKALASERVEISHLYGNHSCLEISHTVLEDHSSNLQRNECHKYPDDPCACEAGHGAGSQEYLVEHVLKSKDTI
jgi:hypothetical protein